MSRVTSKLRGSLLRNCVGGSELVQKLVIIAVLALAAITAVRALASRVSQTFHSAGRTLEAQIPTRAIDVSQIASSITPEMFPAQKKRVEIKDSPTLETASHAVTPQDAPGRIGQRIEAVLSSRFAHQRGTLWNVSEGNQLDGDWLLQSPPPSQWGNLGHAGEETFYVAEVGYNADFGLPHCRDQRDCKTGVCGQLAATSRSPGETPEWVCLGHSDFLIDEVYNTIITARHEVRIANFMELGFQYEAAIRNALLRLNAEGKSIDVRILLGTGGIEDMFQSVSAGLPKDSKIRVTVGTYGGGFLNALSWNHSKIISVDGREAIVGGHVFAEVNNHPNPVHDVSIRVRGPAARDAERFFDSLWNYMRLPQLQLLPLAGSTQGTFLTTGGPVTSSPVEPSDEPHQKGGARIISVGTAGGLAFNFLSKSPSDDAIYTLIDSAEDSVRMSQESLVSPRYYTVGQGLLKMGVPREIAMWPIMWKMGISPHISSHLLDHLGLALMRGVTVDIVVSPVEVANKDYGGDWSAEDIRTTIIQHVQTNYARLKKQAERDGQGQEVAQDRADLDWKLANLLQVHGLRDLDDPKKSGGNHAKMVIVDDSAFYVGSQNLYPGGIADGVVTQLAEFGYIVDDPKATGQLVRDYWNPTWNLARLEPSLSPKPKPQPGTKPKPQPGQPQPGPLPEPPPQAQKTSSHKNK